MILKKIRMYGQGRTLLDCEWHTRIRRTW